MSRRCSEACSASSSACNSSSKFGCPRRCRVSGAAWSVPSACPDPLHSAHDVDWIVQMGPVIRVEAVQPRIDLFEMLDALAQRPAQPA
jgi:hypothetical protein